MAYPAVIWDLIELADELAAVADAVRPLTSRQNRILKAAREEIEKAGAP